MNKQHTNQCPRCGQASLRAWDELTEEEREVVRRLPGSADHSDADRTKLHRWCSRCWYESRSAPLDT